MTDKLVDEKFVMCRKMFLEACRDGNLPAAKAASVHYSGSFARVLDNGPLRLACAHGRLEIAQWLYATFAMTHKDVATDNYTVFRLACANGHLETAKWLADIIGPSGLTAGLWDCYYTALRAACANCQLEVAQWIESEQLGYSLNDFKIRILRDETWSHICEKGRMDFALWFTKFGLPQKEAKARALSVACEHGHLALAKWLAAVCSLTTVEVSSLEDNSALYAACKQGHLDVAQWLVSYFRLTRGDVRCRGCACLQAAYDGDYLDLACWLADSFGGLDA